MYNFTPQQFRQIKEENERLMRCNENYLEALTAKEANAFGLFSVGFALGMLAGCIYYSLFIV